MMKRKLIILALAAAVALSAAVLSRWRSPPTISFIGFQGSSPASSAVFRINNDSDGTFTYMGSGPAFPDYRYDSKLASGSVGLGFRVVTLRPHSCVDFAVAPPVHGPFRVAVRFERGDKNEWWRRHSAQLARIDAYLRGWLANRLHWTLPRLGWTWSGPVDARRPPAPKVTGADTGGSYRLAMREPQAACAAQFRH